MPHPMTSRERVVTALHRGIPDRLPVSFFGNPGICARMRAHFGLPEVDKTGFELSDALDLDMLGLWPAYTGPRLHPELPGRQVQAELGIRTRWIEHQSGGYWDYCDFPLAGADPETIANWPMPKADDYDYAAIPERVRQFAQRAVHVGGPGLGDIMNSNGMLFGQEEMLVALASEDEAFLHFVDRRIALNLEITRRAIEAAKGRIDFVWIGEDLGTQHSPLISLDMFRRLILPHHRKLIAMATSFNLPVMLHSCGSSSWAFPDFIAAGLAAVDTLQPEATNMSPAYLKATFGDKLAFHGCISTAGPVATGTVAQVRQYCRDIIEIMKPGGGYLFAPTHSLQDNSPTENVVAMYETAREYGRY